MKIAVIGSGTMGAGIAQVLAQSHDVILRDIDESALERAMKGIEKNLSRSVEKGRMEAAEKDATIARIKVSADIQDIKDADLVIEAATENAGIK